LAFYGINKLSKFIKVHKDPLLNLSSNMIYKIKCLHYDASYVNQTRRLLKDRIDKTLNWWTHKNHIKRNNKFL